MTLVGLLVVIVVLVVITWLLQTAPIAQPFKWILTAVVVVLVLAWLLESHGAFGPIYLGGHGR